MMKLQKYGDVLYFVFRALIGVLFFMVGSTKLFGWFGGAPVPIPVGSLVWFAGLIEVVAGALIVLGLLTRYAAGLSAVEMVVAYAIGHAPNGWNPIANQGIPALLFFAAFLALVAKGAGRWAFDKK
jgi:putative oxidoreductase